MDQSFSAQNFRKIIDLENRKGVYLEGRFFPSLKRITDKIKKCNSNIRHYRKINSEKKEIKECEKKDALKKKKESMCLKELEKISEKALRKDFSLDITQKIIPNGKPQYLVDSSPEQYFVIKQAQYNINRLFKVKQSNRFEIVSQVLSILGDDFPKYVIKTDIDDFYESIPHLKLYQIIDGNNLLSPPSRKFLKQLLRKYEDITGLKVGVPRGVGVSAYLSELFMREVDDALRYLPGVSYYARYVDDIIIIFVPIPNDHSRDFIKEVKDVIEGDFGLKINDSPPNNKTKCLDLRIGGSTQNIDYLGYRVFFSRGNIKTRLTRKKINRYKNRIDRALNDFVHSSKINEKAARKILVKRFRFLTGNTRLKNRKKNALVGVYYSNCHLTDIGDLIGLDKYYENEVNKIIRNSHLKRRLLAFSFEKGFLERRYSAFKTHEFVKIMKVWK